MVNTLLRYEDAAGHESSVGKPDPLTEIKLLTADGQSAGVGEVGEIYTRSPAVSIGYWNRPEANAETFVDDDATYEEAQRVWERELFRRRMERLGNDQTRVSKSLGISRATFYRLLERSGIREG